MAQVPGQQFCGGVGVAGKRGFQQLAVFVGHVAFLALFRGGGAFGPGIQLHRQVAVTRGLVAQQLGDGNERL
ncbi:hypothetical protein D3C78_1930770 [compost metagenome]